MSPPAVDLQTDLTQTLGACSDVEWLALLNRSVREESIEGVPFPRFPSPETQKGYVGRANEVALEAAAPFYAMLKEVSARSGNPLQADSQVLDFGCGWGRFLRFFWKDVRPGGLFGVDVDPAAVELCRALGVPGSFSLLAHDGELPFADGAFSHLLAHSVFTHLSESSHRHWLPELARVLRPGGTFALTILSDRFLEQIPAWVKQQEAAAKQESPTWASRLWARITRRAPEPPPRPLQPWLLNVLTYAPQLEEMRKDFAAGKLIYFPTGGGKVRPAEHYGNTVTPLAYIEKVWGEYFTVCEYIDDPQRFPQAALIVQRR